MTPPSCTSWVITDAPQAAATGTVLLGVADTITVTEVGEPAGADSRSMEQPVRGSRPVQWQRVVVSISVG